MIIIDSKLQYTIYNNYGKMFDTSIIVIIITRFGKRI